MKKILAVLCVLMLPFAVSAIGCSGAPNAEQAQVLPRPSDPPPKPDPQPPQPRPGPTDTGDPAPRPPSFH